MCALTAAQQGKSVLVLEKANKIGKKILMSGGGRCNFTNHFVEADNFICSNPHFVKSALSRYTQWDFIALVEQHGIPYEERSHSQLFCLDSAKDILDMLLEECQLGAVTLKKHCDISNIKTLDIPQHSTKHQQQDDSKRYQVKYSQGHDTHKIQCRSLVVATGALSIPTLGGSGFGYDIAQQFGLDIKARRAGLVPFMFSDFMKPICERLSGLALDADVSCGQQSFRENILFTHRGISGPAILQISNYWSPGDNININLLPDLQATEFLLEAKHTHSKNLLKNILSKKLSKSLVQELQTLWWADNSETAMAEFPDQKLKLIGELLNNWQLKPSATEGYRTAEVTLGGIDTDAISSKTMEAKQQPGLFFIGEVLDVSGHLGGFNFQWAWSSGYSAGMFV